MILALSLALLLSTGEPPVGDVADAPVEGPVDDATPDEPPVAEQPVSDATLDSEPAGDTPVTAPNTAPNSGGFGSVESVTTESNVQAPAPVIEDEDEAPSGPTQELSALLQAGYAQTNLANAEGLDHHGLFLRAHLVFYPWVARSRRVGVGIGAMYSYHGLNRWQRPEGQPASKAQQQLIMISADLLLRPHLQWFSLLASGAIGLGFYGNAKLLAADRPSTIAKDEFAFVAGGSAGLCTAWDIVCVVGGAQILLDVLTQPVDALVDPERVIDPWGWHIGLGVDVLRILARTNRLPS